MTRDYQKFQSVIANIGGIYSSIFGIASLLVQLFSLNNNLIILYDLTMKNLHQYEEGKSQIIDNTKNLIQNPLRNKSQFKTTPPITKLDFGSKVFETTKILNRKKRSSNDLAQGFHTSFYKNIFCSSKENLEKIEIVKKKLDIRDLLFKLFIIEKQFKICIEPIKFTTDHNKLEFNESVFRKSDMPFNK
jgi:hypothetical protein